MLRDMAEAQEPQAAVAACVPSCTVVVGCCRRFRNEPVAITEALPARVFGLYDEFQANALVRIRPASLPVFPPKGMWIRTSDFS
jgi:hypothetical protein